ncbi:MAG: T9SS type A sorting domain-containing protein [Bacteroidota bacterium]
MKRILLAFCFCLIVATINANDTLTRAQVYNFNVGDTFDYEYSSAGLPTNPTTYQRKIVTAKYYSSNSDTLFIALEVVSGLMENLVLRDLHRNEIYLVGDSFCQHDYSIDSNSIYGGRTVNGVAPVLCGEINYTDSFAYGLGRVYESRHFRHGLNNDYATSFEKLIYYSQAGEVWGTPYTLYTNLDEITINPFHISPNPANNTLTINIDESLVSSTATITDITGRTLTAVELVTSNQQLATDHFASGVYFVTVSNGKSKATKKLIVSR